jgi:putative SOS response-associated peptidase YedK
MSVALHWTERRLSHECVDATIADPTSNASPKLLNSAGCPRASSCRPTGTSHPVPNSPLFGRTPETGEREMVLMRWGLVPARIADPDSFKIYTTTNARAEGILDKPIWKGPFAHSRCLIPLDGFYESLQRPSLPQPPPIEPEKHGLFGDILAPAKRTPKPKAGSGPVYKFDMADGRSVRPGWALL